MSFSAGGRAATEMLLPFAVGSAKKYVSKPVGAAHDSLFSP